MDTAIVVFARDLRLHDDPALHQACARARQVVPLFVVDPAIAAPPNRARFLADSLADLRQALRGRGGDLVLRQGDPAAEVIGLATDVNAGAVYIADDVSHYAMARRHKLERECARHRIDLVLTPGLTVVPPAALRPAAAATTGSSPRTGAPGARPPGAGATRCRRGSRCPPSRTSAVSPRATPPPRALRVSGTGPGRRAGRCQRFAAWRHRQLAGYREHHDDLAGDATSRLSAYLRFGCVSPLEAAIGALDRAAGNRAPQRARRGVLPPAGLARLLLPGHRRIPGHRHEDLPAEAWHTGEHALDAWRAGQTGIPIVDAGMRQLAAEGFMHNRSRMITASFLTRNLGIDWRHGYRRFDSLLADGDVASNAGNWQWVAGTGNDTRPNRVMNPLRQAQRFDRDGEYVRRYVPELAGLDAAHIRTPWRLPGPRAAGVSRPDCGAVLIDPARSDL